MAIHSYAPREFKPQSKWGGKQIKKLVCFHCQSTLCRHVIRIGYLEVQCPQCGGTVVIKSGDPRRDRPRPGVHRTDGKPVQAN